VCDDDDVQVLQVITATEAHVELLADWNRTFKTCVGDALPSLEDSRMMAVSWVDGRDGSKAYLLCVRSHARSLARLAAALTVSPSNVTTG
jgi:hypothetical protein